MARAWFRSVLRRSVVSRDAPNDADVHFSSMVPLDPIEAA